MFYYWLVCLNSFEFDPDYYLSVLCCSLHPVLRLTDLNLKLIRNLEKNPVIESMIRAGITMI